MPQPPHAASGQTLPSFDPRLEFPTPIVAATPSYDDTIIVEIKSRKLENYTPLPYGTPHPDTALFPNHKLTWQDPTENQEWVLLVYAADRANQDTYNYSLNYVDESSVHPIYTRDYLIARNAYAAITALTADPVNASALLTHQEMLSEPTDKRLKSLYVATRRQYKVMPGPWVYTRDRVRSGILKETKRRLVVATTIPGTSGTGLTQMSVKGESVAEAYEIVITFTNDAGTPIAAPIYAFEEIDEKENVTRIRHEQEQPYATAVTPNLDATYGTAKVWAPDGDAVLTGITVTYSGTGYTSAPTVTIAAPTGTPAVQATATASLKALSAVFATPGSGYALNNTVTPNGGTFSQAAVFTVSGFSLSTLALNAPGTGHNTGDLITLVGGTFTTAGVVTVTTCQLVGVTPDEVGSGYILGESITFGGGTFTTAGAGTVSTLNVADTPTVDAAGTNYLRNDVLTLVGGTFTTAATPVVNFIKLVSITGSGGSGYDPGDDIYCLGGTWGDQAVLDVTSTKVTAATIAVAGSGYTNGLQTFTVDSGTGTQATVQITVTGGVPGGAVTVLTAGSYTANPDAPSATTGPAGTGLTLNLSMGVNAVSVVDGGRYLTGSATLTQYPYLGSNGTGATFTSGVYGVHSIRFDTFASRGNYTSVPPTFTTSGGAGTGATFNGATAGVRTVTITTPGSYSVTPAELTQSSSGNGSGATFVPSFGVLTFSISTAGNYTVTSTTFTQGSTTGTGTGATFQTATFSVLLTLTTAGVYTVIPSNPVTTTTNGAGTLMTLTVTWGLGAVTITNSGKGYLVPNPKVTISGGGGAGARAVAVGQNSVWREATAYIIDGGVEDIEGDINKRVWWLTAPVPPVRREYPWESFTFPAIFRMYQGEYLSPFVARPGINYDMRDHRVGTYPARLTIESQLGVWQNIQPSFEVITRATNSNYFPKIGPNTIHGPIVIYEREQDGSLTLAERIDASTPTYAEYKADGVYLVRQWQERVWDSNIWQKFTLEIAEGYTVGLGGYGDRLIGYTLDDFLALV